MFRIQTFSLLRSLLSNLPLGLHFFHGQQDSAWFTHPLLKSTTIEHQGPRADVRKRLFQQRSSGRNGSSAESLPADSVNPTCSKHLRASKPPAEAPIPTMRKPGGSVGRDIDGAVSAAGRLTLTDCRLAVDLVREVFFDAAIGSTPREDRDCNIGIEISIRSNWRGRSDGRV